MRRLIGMLGVALLATACPGPTGGQGGGTVGGQGEGGSDTSAAVTPEQMEEIQRTVRNGQDAVTHCYTEEMERTGDKKLTGKVVVKIQVGTTGRADQVVIGDATLKSPTVHACIIGVVKSWEFPRIPTVSWFTYPFEFSPAY